jgi:hypothetical protein
MIFHGPIQSKAYWMGQATLVEDKIAKHVRNLIIEANDLISLTPSAVLTKQHKFIASLYF